MALPPDRRAYFTLDGLRGVGAALVITRHVPLFGGYQAPASYLAVDLFYLVSGFVVAHAYAQRLQQGGFFRTFAITRLIRLYPLYLLGLALGVVTVLIAMRLQPAGFWTPERLAVATVTGVLMIPRFPGLSINGSTMNGPIWTLLYELVANFVYAGFIRLMTTAVLAAIIAVSAAALIFARFHYGTLNIGFSLTDQWAALARVGFSFFAGVLIARFMGSRRIHSPAAAWACLLVLALALITPLSGPAGPYVELGLVLLGFPALLVAAAWVEPGPRTGAVFAKIGLVSYAVYLLHAPLGFLVRRALVLLHIPVPHGAPGILVGSAFVLGVGLLAWWLDGAYDAPMRRWLRARLLK